MAVIVPRWEWRTFGSSFGAAEATFADLEPTAVQESDETYLLHGDEASLKIRDGLLDIKVLLETDAHGLQRWEPVRKAPFPLEAEAAAHAFALVGLEPPAAPPEGWTLEAFIARVAGPTGPAQAVPVHKVRTRYRFEGCSAEVAEVSVGRSATRTLAVESEDAAAVLAAVRALDLADHLNVGYPAGLRDLVAGAPERRAVIDVGTNSVKLHVAEREAGSGWQTVLDRADVTRLGEGLAEHGTIAGPALERTAEAITAMAAEARALRVRSVTAVGTAGLRSATDREAAVAELGRRAGLELRVISGEEESRLAYLAVVAGVGVGEGSVVVFDTGGGSSQFTFGRGRTVAERFSLDVGAVRITERFGLQRSVSEAVVDEACAAVATDLARLAGHKPTDRLVGMGGAVTNLTAVSLAMSTYDGARIDGATLTREELERQIVTYRGLDAEARRAIVGLQPKRAEVILAGACIVRTIMELLEHEALTVSDRGLRQGVLIDRFGTGAAA